MNQTHKRTKGWILHFLKKGKLGIIKNYRGITLIAKVCNALFLNYIQLDVKKILKKNLMGFRRNQSTISHGGGVLVV